MPFRLVSVNGWSSFCFRFYAIVDTLSRCSFETLRDARTVSVVLGFVGLFFFFLFLATSYHDGRVASAALLEQRWKLLSGKILIMSLIPLDSGWVFVAIPVKVLLDECYF